jgi:hypothetical protein
MWWQLAAAIVGLGLMAVPDLTDLAVAPANLIHIVAPVGAAFAVVAASGVTRAVRWMTVVCGIVIALGVALLGVPVRELVVAGGGGLLMSALALGGGRVSRSYGGGWRALLG